jgi:hypothetical protein
MTVQMARFHAYKTMKAITHGEEILWSFFTRTQEIINDGHRGKRSGKTVCALPSLSLSVRLTLGSRVRLDGHLATKKKKRLLRTIRREPELFSRQPYDPPRLKPQTVAQHRMAAEIVSGEFCFPVKPLCHSCLYVFV